MTSITQPFSPRLINLNTNQGAILLNQYEAVERVLAGTLDHAVLELPAIRTQEPNLSQASEGEMGFESAPSSCASIISIDPAIASQITGATEATNIGAHSRADSSSAKRTKTSENVTSGRHTRNRSVPIAVDKKTPNSLRRAKNSTEVLRQRSTKSTKKPKQLETIPDTREGRNFTIGNVGTGGVLYLKPSAHQNASMQTSPPVIMPLTAPANLPALIHNDEKVKPLTQYQTRSDSPSTAIWSTSPKQSFTAATRRPTAEMVRSRHGRSLSFSTVEQQRPSFAGTRSKTLKIVINRPETAKGDPSEGTQTDAPLLSLPTLAVPIPHYRIGTPRFSDHGTPMLRSSACSRTSATALDTNHPDASVQAKPSNLLRGRRQPVLEHLPSWVHHMLKLKLVASALQIHGQKPQIRPRRIRLSENQFIRRYTTHWLTYTTILRSSGTLKVSGRLLRLPQLESSLRSLPNPSWIMSLVSDFFLTFRSYLSTYTVLDLLLARLRWAIDKPQDDGRIIRVRTFAALRHWILNYFMDDFMADKKLRVRFCNEINRMYHGVSSRLGRGD